MKREYNSVNLICDAEFVVKIARGIEWVPTAILGRTVWRATQLPMIWNLPANERRQYVNNLYEAVQLFHISQFEVKDNKNIVECGDSIWEISRNGREVVRDNCGMCAECAAWLIYYLKGVYEEIGFLTFIGTRLGGHIINYIKHRGYFYFVDMSMQTREMAVDNAVENGDIREFRKNKHLTCSMLRSKSIEDFCRFYCLFYRRRMREFFSFYYMGDCAIPIGFEKGRHTILLPHGYGVNIIEAPRKTSSIKWKMVELPDKIWDAASGGKNEGLKCQ